MTKTQHPYRGLPAEAFWKKSVAGVKPGAIDPVGRFDLRITTETKVATAGSCFAQHIARHLASSGYNYYVAETAHPLFEGVAAEYNYGLYSARYGNIYTARQLRQLMDRALGAFTPVDDVWRDQAGNYVDPFRPSIQPGNFRSESEMRGERRHHLASVRQMFETLDVFVFTLGLTECWVSRADGAVYPICPGVEGGEFDPGAYAFHNQSAPEAIADMTAFLRALRSLNPTARVILTVSPVPLAATAVPGEHVLTATTYSKAVLRVVAETLREIFDFVDYFPSYEIITSAAARGAYYAEDLRNVTEAGVTHVMRTFLRHVAAETPLEADAVYGEADRVEEAPPAAAHAGHTATDFLQQASHFVEVLCDEEKLAAE